MNTEVANASTASTALGALRSLKQGIANVQQTLVNKSATPFLRLGRDGKWIYGAESIEVEDGSLWAANPLAIEHGWVAWDRSKDADNSGGPLGEVMVPMNHPCPPKDTLKDVGHDWSYQLALPLICINGTDKGEQVEYKANSVGGIDALDGLIKAIGIQIDADENNPVPVIALGSASYQHKKYGKTYTPELNIQAWVPLTDQLPQVADPAPKAPVEAAKPRTRSVPATTAKAAAQEAAVDANVAEEEDDELAALQRQIAEKKAAKEAASKSAADAVDPVAAAKAAAKAKLLAEMAALDAEDGGEQADAPKAEAPAAGAPQRRRRA